MLADPGEAEEGQITTVDVDSSEMWFGRGSRKAEDQTQQFNGKGVDQRDRELPF